MKIKLELRDKKYEGNVEEVKEPTSYYLIRAENEYEVFDVIDRVKHWIQNPETAQILNYDLNTTTVMSLDKVNYFITGDTFNMIGEAERPRDIYFPDEPEPEKDVIKILFAYTGKLVPLVKDLGFTAYQDYGKSIATGKKHLKAAKASGMKYMPTLPDKASEAEIKERINAYKDHPAYWGILSFDDADFRTFKRHWTPDDMRRVYNDIKKYDEEHPVCGTVCHGASRTDDSWIKYLAIDAFDVLFYEIYVYRTTIPDPDEWLKYMYDRLNDYPQLQDKIIIPLVPTFERTYGKEAFTDPTGHIWDMYEYSKGRLGGKKSSGCYDWECISRYKKYHPEIKQINQDL